MTSELSSEARRLIEESRGFDDARAGDQDRLRARIAAHVATGVGLGALSGTARAAAGGGWFGRALGSGAAPKVALATVVAAGAAVAVMTGWPRHETVGVPAAAPVAAGAIAAPSSPPASEVVDDVALAARAAGSAAPSSAAAPSESPSEQVAAPVSVERSAPAHRPRKEGLARSSIETGPGSELTGDPLDEELKLLSSARAGLKRGAASEALERLEEHDRRFPSGVLLMESRALRVDALCEAGQREAAHEAADAFLKRWPDSPLVARVRSACR